MDYNNALYLTSAFGDFKNFKTIFLAKNRNYKFDAKLLERIDFRCIPFEIPQTEIEQELCYICLENIMFNCLN